VNALKSKYRDHKYNAAKRGVPFRLTFEEWLNIWTESGHLHERGPHAGQYVMARFGDAGGYEVGNVKIIPHIENIKERKFSADVLAQRSAARLGKQYLGPERHSEETKRVMAEKRRQWWAKKKESADAGCAA
jgi:hypothetical protein